MKTKVSIILIGIILSCLSGAAKKIDFYIPPVSKVRIDPTEWDLPYTKPYAYVSPMFKGNSNKVTIKNKVDLITYTFRCIYLPDDSLQAKYKINDGRRKVRFQPMIGNFEVYEGTYGESKDGFTYFIDKSTPNFALIILADFSLSDQDKLESAKKFLMKFEKVDPTEIDIAVGYPLDKSILVDSLKKSRIAVDRKNNSSSYYYDSNKERERKLVMDYTIGFTYKEYFDARIRLERNNYTDDEKARYAFHLSEGLKGLMLLDSMSDYTYKSSKNEKKFLDEYLKKNPKNSSFNFNYATEIKRGENGYWWFLSNGPEFSIAYVTTGVDGKLYFDHHFGESAFWEKEGKLMKKMPVFLNDQSAANYKAIELLGADSSIIKLQIPVLVPTRNGREYQGVRTYFVDTKNPKTDIVVFETVPIQDKFKLVYAELGFQKSNTLFRGGDVNLGSSKKDYSLYMEYPNEGWGRYYTDSYWSDYEEQLSSFNMIQGIDPTNTLVIMGVESVSVNGELKLVRPYVSNGKLIACDVLNYSSNGLSKGQLSDKIEAELLKLESYKSILEKSKLKYAEFNKKVSPKAELISISNSQLKNYETSEVPEVVIHPNGDGRSNFTLSESDIKRIVSSIKYPEKAKAKQIGGVVTMDVVLDPSGKVISVKAVNVIPGSPELSIEAERIIKTFGTFTRESDTLNQNSTIQVSIRFVP